MGSVILKYSNGWGHLIMSLALLGVAVVLVFQHDTTLTGTAVGLILSVAGYWIATSAANSQNRTSAPAPTPAPVPAAPVQNTPPAA